MRQNNYTIKLSSIFVCASILLISILIYNYYKPDYKTINDIHNAYDYIIVGAGTSGCVLASKLSKNSSKSVLLIEAGDEFNFLASIPLLAVLLQGTKNDWSYKSEPQKYSSFGLENKIQFLPRGKGIGGSNQINYLVHGTDIQDDIEKWKNLNISNWKNIKLYLDNPTFFNTSLTKSELSKLMCHASRELNDNNIKYIPPQNSIHNGKRWTSFHSYLKSITSRENLDIVINTQVIKIHFDKKQAIAVQLLDKNNNKKYVLTRNEIILSAGAFNTPQILLHSGIGPANLLKKLKIPQILNLPGVGKNLHDHLNMPLYVSIEKPISLTMDKVLSFSEIWKYFIYNDGLLSTSPNAGFIRKSDAAVLLFGMGSTDEKIYRKIANIKLETFEHLFPFHNNKTQEGFVLLSTCLKPLSRGYISIKNSNPLNLASINPQYLSKFVDIKCMIQAIKLAKKLINTETFKNIGGKIHWPKFENCKTHLNENFEDNDEYFECIIRTAALTGYHPGGTCKMGQIDDKMAVVDENLNVQGVTGLRIMDASIFPEALGTYPNSILIAMSEYAADLIYNRTNN